MSTPQSRTSPSCLIVKHSRSLLDPALKHVWSRHFQHPRRICRRVDWLLRECARAGSPLIGAPPLASFAILADQTWQRPLHEWSGGSWASLLHHLLVVVPDEFPAVFTPSLGDARVRSWVGRPDYARNIQALAILGRGGGLRELHREGVFPRTVRRPVFRLLMQAPCGDNLERAVRHAQLVLHGVPERWVRQWWQSRLQRFRSAKGEHLLDRFMAWLGRHGEVLPDDVIPDILEWASRELIRRRDPTRFPPEAALRVVAAMVADRQAPRVACGPLRALGVEAWASTVDQAEWTLREILAGEELVAEGQELGHCVATYGRRVQSGRSSIFSLRRDGVRVLTVEVRPEGRAIVQVRGLHNRMPRPMERALLCQWAVARDLTVDRW